MKKKENIKIYSFNDFPAEILLKILSPLETDDLIKCSQVLEKLEKRTQKAIAELIRERLKEEDLANAVAAGASAALAEEDED